MRDRIFKMAIINDAKMEAAPLPNVTSGQPHLSRQDLTNLDITKLTPLSPEVISRQATIDIGTIGHPMGSQLSSRHCLVFILSGLKMSKNEMLMGKIGSLSTGVRVIAVKADLAKIGLTTPVCTSVDEKIALSRRVEKHWRLIGWGQIRNGMKVKPTQDH